MGKSTQPQVDRLLLRIPEVAGALSVSRGTVYNMIAAGDLATITVGKSGVRIARALLETWLESKASVRKETNS